MPSDLSVVIGEISHAPQDTSGYITSLENNSHHVNKNMITQTLLVPTTKKNLNLPQ